MVVKANQRRPQKIKLYVVGLKIETETRTPTKDTSRVEVAVNGHVTTEDEDNDDLEDDLDKMLLSKAIKTGSPNRKRKRRVRTLDSFI